MGLGEAFEMEKLIGRVYDGKVPCTRCKQRLCVGFTDASEYAASFVCGDCLEGRTPLKQELETLRAVLKKIAAHSTYDDEEGDEPDEDDMIDALCAIHTLARPYA